jgi:callose synthase
MFSAEWNKIIDHFREEDIVSNKEMDFLKFSSFDGFSQAVYLPAFQTAGVIMNVLSELERPIDDYKDPKTGAVTDEAFFRPISEHVTMRTTVSEVWELGSYIFKQMLGPVHSKDVTVIMSTILKWSESGTLTSHLKLENMRKIMTQYVAMIELLQKGIHDRVPAAKPRSRKSDMVPKGGGMRRAVSATSLSSLEKPDVEKYAFAEAQAPIIDALRDQVRDIFRNLAYALKGILKRTDVEAESSDILDRITFLLSMENGFLWDDAYASDQLDVVSRNVTWKAVLKKSHGLVACHPDDVEPKSKEVRRRLTFYVNSLFMDMPDAPSIRDMFSWTVSTPYYSEDVTYTRGDLEKRTDALGVSTLL